MSTKPNSPQARFRQEEGFLLLGVLFMILLIMIALAIAAPKMAESIRRDKENETVHRGKQYARAIRIYYAKYGRYPNTIDQLVKSDNQRFLRKRYLDPMTGKDDWRIIHFGEPKVPAQGLFGQTLQQTGGITPTGATTGTGCLYQWVWIIFHFTLWLFRVFDLLGLQRLLRGALRELDLVAVVRLLAPGLLLLLLAATPGRPSAARLRRLSAAPTPVPEVVSVRQPGSAERQPLARAGLGERRRLALTELPLRLGELKRLGAAAPSAHRA